MCVSERVCVCVCVCNACLDKWKFYGKYALSDCGIKLLYHAIYTNGNGMFALLFNILSLYIVCVCELFPSQVVE